MISLLNPTGKGIRVDAGGDGHYGSSRGKDKLGNRRYHNGVDVLCVPGQDIVAPIKGFVTRIAYAYADDLSWKGIVIQGEWCRLKILYIEPFVGAGVQIYRGQPIAKAQNISLRYPDLKMLSHIHIEFEEIIPNPEFFMEGL